MRETERISALIGHIYDAALDPALWAGVLEEIAAFVGGPASALVRHDALARTGGFYYSWGDAPRYTRLYFEKYVKLNPALVPMQLMTVGEVHSISTVIPYEEFRNTRLYKEWAAPQGYGDATMGVLEKSATALTHVTVTHGERDSPAADDRRHRMALLLPHLRRAVVIAGIIDRHRIESGMLVDAVDSIAAGVFLVAPDASIIHANASGRSMLESGAVLRATRARLTPADAHAGRTLHDAIARASGGDAALGRRGIAIPLSSRSDEGYVAHVLPLTSGSRRQSRAISAATATVFVHKMAFGGPTPLEAIARHFGLTPSELRVLMALVEIGGVPEVAPVLGIAATTVKTHLRHVFEKTGTSRQADLVKIVAAFTNPLVRS